MFGQVVSSHATTRPRKSEARYRGVEESSILPCSMTHLVIVWASGVAQGVKAIVGVSQMMVMVTHGD